MGRKFKSLKQPESEFICQTCGNRNYPIVRKYGQQRENGHIKNLWCTSCQKRTKNLEIKENTGYFTMAGWIY